MENYDPNLQTYKETPSPEAIKAAVMISRYCFWMCNWSSLKNFQNCFGPNLGEHFWNKIVHKREVEGSLGGDLGFWFELSINNREKLMHYIIRSNYRGQ